MPQIKVIADERADARVMLSERVTVADFESTHFRTQLGERLAWAVSDAASLTPIDRGNDG